MIMPKKKYPRYDDTSSPHKEFGIKTPYHAGRVKRQEVAEVSGIYSIVKKAKRDKSGKKQRLFFGKKDTSLN